LPFGNLSSRPAPPSVARPAPAPEVVFLGEVVEAQAVTPRTAGGSGDILFIE
jgi:hypothetical protein